VEYLAKRRLSAASVQLSSTSKSITEIALDYQYTSPEVFTRAFKRFWGVTPSQFRKTYRFSELFPKLELSYSDESGGYVMSERRKVDISELYDKLKELRETYILCADLCNLKYTNDTYGYAAGDLLLAEAARRLDNEITQDMFMFRIGRDEFAIISGLQSASEAEALAKRITDLNGNTILLPDGAEISLSLRIGITKIPSEGLSYKEAIDEMHTVIDRAEDMGIYIYTG
jgi:AraC family transcriptional regulator